jgi:hypothetical protein
MSLSSDEFENKTQMLLNDPHYILPPEVSDDDRADIRAYIIRIARPDQNTESAIERTYRRSCNLE